MLVEFGNLVFICCCGDLSSSTLGTWGDCRLFILLLKVGTGVSLAPRFPSGISTAKPNRQSMCNPRKMYTVFRGTLKWSRKQLRISDGPECICIQCCGGSLGPGSRGALRLNVTHGPAFWSPNGILAHLT